MQHYPPIVTSFENQTSATLYVGDALAVLKQLPDQLANACITSPAYWGLRDYGTAPLIWGGREDCSHDWQSDIGPAASGVPKLNRGATLNPHIATKTPHASGVCAACGAWRGSLGHEPTPHLYVEHLVSIFREVRRVLRDDGTLWLNLGDSYAGSYGGYTRRAEGWQPAANTISRRAYLGQSFLPPTAHAASSGLPRRNLVGIPWRVALALQQDGWILRSDIIWHKRNTMPESAKSRPSRAHEYIFLLAKRPRYYYDAEAVREPRQDSRQRGGVGLRQRRSVWTVASSSFRGAHTATFPKELIRPCIRAGSPIGGTILDPFAGAGTTGLVAREEGRSFVGIELNRAYVALARQRLLQTGATSPVP